jgi:hypothetical protein
MVNRVGAIMTAITAKLELNPNIVVLAVLLSERSCFLFFLSNKLNLFHSDLENKNVFFMLIKIVKQNNWEKIKGLF